MELTLTKCDGCGYESKEKVPSDSCPFCDGGTMLSIEGFIYNTLELPLYDHTENTCCTCNTFKTAWIYCPILDFILKEGNLKFDETGENHGCSIHSAR